MIPRILRTAASPLFLSFLACGGGTKQPSAAQIEQACTAMKSGTVNAVSPQYSVEPTTPALILSATYRNVVTLPENAGGGVSTYLSLNAGKAGTYFVYLNKDVPLVASNPQEPPATQSKITVAGCPEIVSAYSFELAPKINPTSRPGSVRFGATPEREVTIVGQSAAE